MFSAIRVYNFFIFLHTIKTLVFILLFLCKPSLLGAALAYSVTLGASPPLPEKAGKLLFVVLGPAAASGLEQNGSPAPGIPRILPREAVPSTLPVRQ